MTVTQVDLGAVSQAEAERDRRAERILDAAGELLVAWGYPRVTVGDIARRAGVGKGTVYLHFSTKEVLFLTVLMRAQSRMVERFVQEIRADPSAVLPSRVAVTAYLWVHEDPIVRAMFTGDLETLGTLSRSAAEVIGDLMKVRERTLDGYVRLLREHGLIVPERSPAALRHAFVAVLTGFLMIEPMLPSDVVSVADNADMVAHVVRAAFETPRAPEEAAAVAPRVADLHQSLLDRLNEEIGRQKRI
ncbi:TetR/AcrR family transcriptional regulator [Microtetraspora fusca]|uniref:TetR/AcrR family transcriptional regulator n=1 Tax=Microtetraspora fusca TaxID=1997 RepID=UPI0009FE1D7D|nr:TetR/AcrR family transcriptional regulator [Microtetraspora fusca]